MYCFNTALLLQIPAILYQDKCNVTGPLQLQILQILSTPYELPPTSSNGPLGDIALVMSESPLQWVLVYLAALSLSGPSVETAP